MDILISGASIAGPSLAFWLRRFGFNPTVVERAPALRPGGQAVDFRGDAHLSVLRRMGVLDEIRRRQTARQDCVFVDESGRTHAVLPADFTAGEVEILRGNLSRILYDATSSDVEYVFGDHITGVVDDGSGVDVTFSRGAPRRFDLVIGADGMHSGVRALAFSGWTPEFLGYYVASFSAPDSYGNTMCTTPGRVASPGLFLFASEELDYDRRDVAAQKEIVARAYEGMGWHTPELLEIMRDAEDFFFDPITRVRMDRITSGRIGLVGDAGYGAALGGMGTGLAIVSSYVLAGELAAHRDHVAAFAAYEALIRPYAAGCQGNPGPFLAPKSRTRIWLRDRMFNAMARLPLGGMFARMDMKAANGITLPDYASAGQRS
ncbi:FAD-dependent oxidoreductase [Lentzea tibetensis]|uniref:FAD-dependent oxidoreductase n=2 Tax=Lentzea tibetensis TaxID=2591470 RepID=A0A563F0Q3_9PSEU|nr:FAD-dependent monooxygenase [Lentzea tibetensis]TWP53358.1 FAD-dependent oxidoreductase [Lentzea tibetensis]